MKKIRFLFVFSINIIVSIAAFASNNHHIDIKSYKYTFSKKDNFSVSYADYPQGEEKFFKLKFKHDAILPQEINTSLRGLKISGNNHSDDLFMYAYKRIDGLKPNTNYHVSFSLEFASNAPQGAMGVGGSPGDGVYVKIGAVNQEPQRYVDTYNNYQITLDKGNQELDGKDMILIGTVGVDTENSIYRLKTLPYQPNDEMQAKLEKFNITSNDQGQAWVVLGTDSGFESTSTFYYTNLNVTFKEIIPNTLYKAGISR